MKYFSKYDISKIISLQKQIRWKINNRNIVRLLKNINIPEISQETDFIKLQKSILDKSYLKNCDEFLAFIYSSYSKFLYSNKITKKITRKFSTIILLKNFSNLILSNNTEFNHRVVDFSSKIMNIIDNLNINDNLNNIILIRLINYIDLYINIYNKWSKLDKRINTYNLLNAYYFNKTNLMDFDNNNNIIVDSLNREQKEIEANVRYLNDDEELIFFNEHKDDIGYNETINTKLYWIDIKYRLSKSDKYVLLELLDYTKVLIKKCIPNRKDLHLDVDSNRDLEFIKQYR